MPHSLKVLFLTEGGVSKGYGHLTRCDTLLREFASLGHKPKMIVCGDKTVSAVLTPGTYTISDWRSRPVPPSDIVVFDSYSLTREEARRISAATRVSVFFDDYNRIQYPKGVLINGAISAHRLRYPKMPGRQYLLGPRYQLVRPEFLKKDSAGSKRSCQRVLISFGGDDFSNLTPLTLKILVKTYPHLDKVVVVGKSSKNLSEIKSVSDLNTCILTAPSVKKLARIMRESTFCICAGGQTLYELAASRTPAVVVGVAENQRLNIEGCQKAGFILLAGWHNSSNLDNKLKKSIAVLLSPGMLDKMRKSAEFIVNPFAAKEVVSRVLMALPDRHEKK